MNNPVGELLKKGRNFLKAHKDIVYPNMWEYREDVPMWESMENMPNVSAKADLIGAWVYVYEKSRDRDSDLYDVYRTMVISTALDNLALAREEFHRAAISTIRFTYPNPNIIDDWTGEPIFEFIGSFDLETIQREYL